MVLSVGGGIRQRGSYLHVCPASGKKAGQDSASLQWELRCGAPSAGRGFSEDAGRKQGCFLLLLPPAWFPRPLREQLSWG